MVAAEPRLSGWFISVFFFFELTAGTVNGKCEKNKKVSSARDSNYNRYVC